MLLPARPSIPTPVAIVVLVLAALVALGLGGAGTGKAVIPGDIDMSQFLQIESGTVTDTFSDLAHDVGKTTWAIRFLALGSLVAAIIRAWPIAIYLATLTILRLAGSNLKAVFESPRPGDVLVQVASAQDTGYGYPSGHAMTVATLSLGLAVLAWRYVPSRRLARVAVIGLVLASVAGGWARVQAGSHWSTDVLGGYAFGVANVAIGVIVLNVLSGRRSPIKSARRRRRDTRMSFR